MARTAAHAIRPPADEPPISAPASAGVGKRPIPVGALGVILMMPPVLALLLAPNVLDFLVTGVRPTWAVRAFSGVVVYTTALGVAHWVLFNHGLVRLPRRAWPRRVVVGVYAASSAALVIVATAILTPLLRLLDPGMVSGGPRLTIQGIIIAYMWLGGSFAYKRHKQRLKEEAERAHRAQLVALDARVRMLQARTNPHFLFNSMNAVMSLIATDPELAEATLGRLSSLFRYALEGSRRLVVPFADDADAVRDYLLIEETRFGERLRFTLEVDPGALEVMVPPMLLQPIVENAVRHGVGQRVEGGVIGVKAIVRGEDLLISVDDDGGGPEASTHQGTGTSMIDLRERLQLLYGDDGRLTVGPTDAGYRAELRLPTRWDV